MSEENVEIIGRIFEAFNQGGIDAVADFLDPEIVFSEPPDQPGATTFHGREKALGGFRRWSEAWEAQQAKVEDVIDTGDRVVVLGRQRLTGRDGIEVEQPNATVFWLQDGMVVRVNAYWDQAEALEAAGLEE